MLEFGKVLAIIITCLVISIIAVLIVGPNDIESPVPQCIETLSRHGELEVRNDTLYFLGNGSISTTDLGLLEVASTQYIVIIGTDF